MNDFENKVKNFERLLDIAERVRDLNQSRIKEYLDTISAIGTMNNLTMENYEMSEKNIKSEDYEKLYNQFSDTLNKLNDNPPVEPSPPGVNPYVQTQKDMADLKLDKMKRLAVILTEQLKANVDFHTHANNALVDSQKKAFDLYKEIDSFTRGR